MLADAGVTADDWRRFDSWSDDGCRYWATELTALGAPSGAVVRCSDPEGHGAAHRYGWQA